MIFSARFLLFVQSQIASVLLLSKMTKGVADEERGRDGRGDKRVLGLAEMPGLFSLIWDMAVDLSRAASGVVMVRCCRVQCSGIAATFVA